MTTLVRSPGRNAGADATATELLGRRAPDVEWSVTWHGPRDRRPGSEQTAQALAGLMTLHGDATGAPRGLRLGAASVAAGLLAAQGALAAQIARCRGGPATSVQTSALAAALLFASHHIAVAGAGRGPARGRHPTTPPFRSADGRWFELEAIGFDAWVGLWHDLGASEADASDGWASFARRYVMGSCQLPVALHDCTRRRRYDEIEARAVERGVAAIPAREGARTDLAPWRLKRGPPGRPARAPDDTPAAERPLAGVRVVELTSRLQGPLAGRLLHWLGADVLKVEPPGGDPGRLAPAGPFRAAYLAYNHGKRFAEVDYRTPAGRSELADLVADADIFLHNARPGRAERYGFDAKRLERGRPGLVHVQLAGWEPDDGRGDTVAGDYVVQADSGVAAALSAPGEPPRPSPLTLLDVMGGILGSTAALAGLLDRERAGSGTRARTTLGAAASLLIRWGSEASRGAEDPVPTASGWLAVAAGRVNARRLALHPALALEEELAAAGVACAAVRTDLGALASDARTADLLAPVADGVFAAAAPCVFTA